MSNWIYIDDIEVTDKVNTIHCDTRDFHCSVREDKIDLRDARHPEITKVLHTDKYLIHQDEIKGFLKGLETITGGKGESVRIPGGEERDLWILGGKGRGVCLQNVSDSRGFAAEAVPHQTCPGVLSGDQRAGISDRA